MTIRHNIFTPLVAAILSGMAATSCVSDAGEPASPTDQVAGTAGVSFSISALPLAGASTRATANYTDPELAESPVADHELINNWVVAFIRDNKVVALVDGKPSAVWNDRVNLELPRGTRYSALAFANIDVDKVKAIFAVGTPLADGWKNTIFDESWLSSDTSLIPMSGYLENFEIKGTVNEEFAIEVVRMKAKIEYAVKNLSTSAITISTFSLQPVYDGDIYLYPEYDRKPVPDTQTPAYAPRIPATGGKYGIFRHEPTGFTLAANNTTEVKRGQFYINESIATRNHPTDHFHIGLTLKRGDETAEDVSYALADDDLKFICRNDYILFPIVISDYVPEFEVIDFPPIGGYPVNVTAENNEFYATFSNSGAFDISARLRDSRGNTKVIQPYDGTVTQDNYVKYVGSVNPEGFELTYEPTLGTWQGNFAHGTNPHITLKFEFKIGDLIYTRTLHLISK